MTHRTVIQSVSPRQLVSLGPEASVHEAACAMTAANCGSALVVDLAGSLLGIVTERDLMTRVIARSLDPAATRVSQVMTAHPRCIGPDARVEDAVLVMIERGFRHLPILSPDGRLMGVFSMRDAMPREVDAAGSLADFHEQVNDALG